jgi:hypothetical protein
VHPPARGLPRTCIVPPRKCRRKEITCAAYKMQGGASESDLLPPPWPVIAAYVEALLATRSPRAWALVLGSLHQLYVLPSRAWRLAEFVRSISPTARFWQATVSAAGRNARRFRSAPPPPTDPPPALAHRHVLPAAAVGQHRGGLRSKKKPLSGAPLGGCGWPRLSSCRG